jgi:hypothetical protein
MTRNVGGTDRGVRLVLGAVLVAIAIFVALPGYWELVPFLIGVALLATAISRYCPVNAALGVDTRRP